MDEQERIIREEIAIRILTETIINTSQIARWTGLNREEVMVLAKKYGRLKLYTE